jgi:RHS repeat-associated protein
VEVDNHVVFAGTRIASVKPSRSLYYYRTRLGTVVATSLGGGLPGAAYRYTAYGKLELSLNDVEGWTRSELGYTNALKLSGGLIYLKARVYDPATRTFMQADSVDRLRYAYVTGDPVNLADPTGLLPIGYILNGWMTYVPGPEQASHNTPGTQDWRSSEKRNPTPGEQTQGEQQKNGTALETEQEKLGKEAQTPREENEQQKADEAIKRLDRQLERRDEIVKELKERLQEPPPPTGMPPRGPLSIFTWLYRAVRFLVPFIDAAERGERNRAASQAPPPGERPPADHGPASQRPNAEPPRDHLPAPRGSGLPRPSTVGEPNRGGPIEGVAPRDQVGRLP